MRNLFLALFVFSNYFLIAQTNKEASDKLYNEGLKYFQKSEYRIADSLFTLSINLKPSADSYFNRALARDKMNDETGYCIDMALAATKRDKEASRLFWINCAKKDSAYYLALPQYQVSVINHIIEIIQKDTLLNKTSYSKINSVDSLLVQYEINNQDTVFYVAEKQPEFPGGDNMMYNFIYRNLRYPNSARENGIQGKVYITFIVTKEGEIKDIKVLYGPPILSNEGIRLVEIMPNWIPGIQNGEKINCQVTLPFQFRLSSE